MQLKITKSLIDLQNDNYSLIKGKIYEFIIKTSNFPEWKQVNYADDYSSLSIENISTSITTAQQQLLDNIISVRAWKTELLLERDRVKVLIFDAVDVLEIRNAVNSLVLTPPPFKL